MRQGQPQNRQRSRGRGNNSNRNRNNNSNNLNRSMESNGPDVRIRGTASHIADKYQQLARDAQSAGDIVAAESYWQHAEHYSRLIAAAQAAQNQLREEQQRNQASAEENSSGDDSKAAAPEGDDGNRQKGRGRRSRNDNREQNAPAEASESVNGNGPQPVLSDTPAEVALADKPVNDTKVARKPRTAKRPSKTESNDEAMPVAAEAKAELPAFISGAAEE